MKSRRHRSRSQSSSGTEDDDASHHTHRQTSDEGLSSRSQRRIQKAKDAARPELTKHNTWQRHDYQRDFEQRFPIDDPTVPNNIDYVDFTNVTPEKVLAFEQHYIKNKIPCVITNGMTHWQANKKWTKRRLSKKYRNQSFKCGEDDDGHNVKIKMKYYVEYMNNTTDDSPLYIFDANYGEHPKNKQLLEDYEIPPPFVDDVFEYVPDKKRPPHRWLVMGPARSGTGIHIDPLGTSAWNALISGYKRWFILPTRVSPSVFKVTSEDDRDQRDEGVTWFMMSRNRTLRRLPADVEPIEVIQKPGEIMYVPSGWWHTVLNLSEAVAVTQNFAHREHWEVNYHKAARGRPKMTRSLMKTLQVKRPELYERARRVNLKVSSGQASSSSSDDSSSSSSSSDSDEEMPEGPKLPYKLPINSDSLTTDSSKKKKQRRGGMMGGRRCEDYSSDEEVCDTDTATGKAYEVDERAEVDRPIRKKART